MRWLRRHARLLYGGTGLLLAEYRRWLLPGQLRVALARITGNLVALGFGITVLGRAPVLMWGVTAAWLIPAWRRARAAERARAADAAFLQLLTDAISDRTGVHLRDVLALMHREKLLPDWKVTDVRAACERLGVPVRESLSVGGQVTVGVHRDDLDEAYPILGVDQQTLPHRDGAAPSPAASPAGHEPTSPTATPIGGGAGWLIHGSAPEDAPAKPSDLEDHIIDALNLLDDEGR